MLRQSLNSHWIVSLVHILISIQLANFSSLWMLYCLWKVPLRQRLCWRFSPNRLHWGTTTFLGALQTTVRPLNVQWSSCPLHSWEKASHQEENKDLTFHFSFFMSVMPPAYADWRRWGFQSSTSWKLDGTLQLKTGGCYVPPLPSTAQAVFLSVRTSLPSTSRNTLFK